VPLGQKPSLEKATNFFHPDDRERLSQAIKGALEHGEPYDMEVRFTTAKGNELWTRTICHPRIVDGKTVKLLGTFQDITARKRADEALRESEAKYRELADMLPQIVFETDLAGNLTFVNQNAFDAFGYTKDDFAAGLNAIEMIAPKDRDRAENRMRQIITGTTDLNGHEYNAIKKDGTEFPIIVYSTGILRDGSPGGLRGIMVDITDRKRAEKRLASLKRRNQALLDYSPVCHKSLDLDFSLQYMSSNGFKMLRLDGDSEVYGRPYPFEFFPTAFQNEMKESLKKAVLYLFWMTVDKSNT
jgi:PAS domain S-box-containing protein